MEAKDVGTADLVMFNRMEGHLLIGDYKFGYGKVEAEMNWQLMIYSLGAIDVFEQQGYQVNQITLAIIQPEHSAKASLFTMDRATLDEWARTTLTCVQDKIKEVIASGAPPPLSMYRIDEDVQCKYCPSKISCPCRNQEIDTMLNTSPSEMFAEPDGLAIRLQKVMELRRWIKIAEGQIAGIETEVMDVLESGGKIDGFKMVRGRAGNRRWTNEEQAEKWLAARGFKEKERYDWKVISPTKAEELLSGAPLSTKLKNAFDKLVEKPEGKLTYAPAGDKRQEVVVNSAKDIFQKEEDELAEL